MKLMRLYLRHAPDLAAKKISPTSKSQFLPNIRAMWAMKLPITLEDGKTYLLNSVIKEDTVAKYLSCKGFTGQLKKKSQTGLAEALEKWLSSEMADVPEVEIRSSDGVAKFMLFCQRE